MGHWSSQRTDIADLESYPPDHRYLNPKPCIFYGSVANYHPPNILSAVPDFMNWHNFNHQNVPEHHDRALYVMPEYNGIQIQHQRIAGVPTHCYGRNMQYLDGVGGLFKRPAMEEVPENNQYHATSTGPNSSIALMALRPAGPGIPSVGAVSFMPPEYGGSDPRPMLESGSCPTLRNQPGLVGPQSIMVPNTNHLIQGNFAASQIPLYSNPWLGLNFVGSSGDAGAYAWAPAPELPFLCGNANGACVETRNVGVEGYLLTPGTGSSGGFLHHVSPQGYSNSHHHRHPPPAAPPPPPQSLQRVRRHSSVNLPTVASSSLGISATSDSSNFREISPYSNARHLNLPHLRISSEDEVAILEIVRHHEAGNSIDQHVDMRLDIDHMTYEELLALGEQIGSVGTGLSEEFVQNNLKTRIFASISCVNLEEAPPIQDQIDSCVICQTDFEIGETNGTLDCGHEYHLECIKKWLLVKNICPICNSTALSGAAKVK